MTDTSEDREAFEVAYRRRHIEKRDAYWKDARKFFLGYGILLIVGSFLFRWSLNESNELIRNAMTVVAGFVFLASWFVGDAACEAYYMLKGFDSDYLYPQASFPRWFGLAKSLSSILAIAIAGGIIWFIANLK